MVWPFLMLQVFIGAYKDIRFPVSRHLFPVSSARWVGLGSMSAMQAGDTALDGLKGRPAHGARVVGDSERPLCSPSQQRRDAACCFSYVSVFVVLLMSLVPVWPDLARTFSSSSCGAGCLFLSAWPSCIVPGGGRTPDVAPRR